MKRHIALIALVLAMQVTAMAAEQPGSFRVWTYQNFGLVLTKYITWSVIPGYRAEAYNTRQDASGMYFIELFTGPVFNSEEMKTGPVITKIILPVWYYYNGYPMESSEITVSTHNVAIAPTMINRFGRWTLMNRLFFHNTIYADMYSRMMGYPEDSNLGFSCLLAWKIEITRTVVGPWKVNLANELYAGIAENRDVPPVTGPGFSEKGIQINRIYAGFSYTYEDGEKNRLTVNPQYILDFNFMGEGVHLRGINHFLYLVMSYSFNLVQPEHKRRPTDENGVE
jgi:hypothetical protein